MHMSTVERLLDLLEGSSELRPLLRTLDQQQVIGRFLNIDLTSKFQSIYEVSSNSQQPRYTTIGYEGWVRSFDAQNSEGLSPYNLFARAAREHELIALDRLCRTLHAINFFSMSIPGFLFLNVHERLLKNIKYDHGRTFAAILIAMGLNPGQIVIEIPEAAAGHRTFLEFILENYHRNGFKVAINLPSAGLIHNLATLLEPDFYKIDARIACSDGSISPLVDYTKHQSIPLIFKQIDSEERLETLLLAGAQYVQGKLFLTQTAQVDKETIAYT